MPPDAERVAREVLDAAFGVHRALGPSRDEEACRGALARGLRRRGLLVEEDAWVPLPPGGVRVGLLVEGAVAVEVGDDGRAEARLRACLRLGGARLGYVLDFRAARLRDGVRRFARAGHRSSR